VGSSVINYYTADVVTANDYYPFGTAQNGRRFVQGNSSYRYGFNGQEKSDDVIVGNTTAEFWEYDSRIGRRWNIDPKPEISVSPYSTLQNNPIWNTDANGDTTRAYSNKTGDLIGTTYSEKGNKALVVKENKVEEVRKLLSWNNTRKAIRFYRICLKAD
jgi:RHS repeat-associated protein